ncbi:MAG: hypothetical protein JWN41_1750 [Thermoleophilia bacterium]|nr:hypothetical protein [Thermoleophilia bacterium]
MRQPFFSVVFLVLLVACKKEAKEEEGEKSGFLLLERLRFTYYEPAKSDYFRESVVAEFHRALSANSYTTIEAGNVRYGDSLLHNGGAIYYSFQPTIPIANFTPGYDGGKLWSISGSPGNVPPFTSTSAPFASFLKKNIDTLSILNVNRPFTLSWDGTVPPDSLEITMGVATRFRVYKGVGSISSFTLASGDMRTYLNNNGPANTTLSLTGTSGKEMMVEGIPVKVITRSIRDFAIQLVP